MSFGSFLKGIAYQLNPFDRGKTYSTAQTEEENRRRAAQLLQGSNSGSILRVEQAQAPRVRVASPDAQPQVNVEPPRPTPRVNISNVLSQVATQQPPPLRVTTPPVQNLRVGNVNIPNTTSTGPVTALARQPSLPLAGPELGNALKNIETYSPDDQLRLIQRGTKAGFIPKNVGASIISNTLEPTPYKKPSTLSQFGQALTDTLLPGARPLAQTLGTNLAAPSVLKQAQTGGLSYQQAKDILDTAYGNAINGLNLDVSPLTAARKITSQAGQLGTAIVGYGKGLQTAEEIAAQRAGIATAAPRLSLGESLSKAGKVGLAYGAPIGTAQTLEEDNPSLKSLIKNIGTNVAGMAAIPAGAALATSVHMATPEIIGKVRQLAADEQGFLGFKGVAEKHPAVQALDDHLKDLNKARDKLMGNNAPKSALNANALAYKATLAEKQKLVKQITQGGYAKVPGKNVVPDLSEPQRSFVNEYANMLEDMDKTSGGVSINQSTGTRASSNSPFYRQVFADKGRPPTKAEWFDEARRQLESGKAMYGASEDYKALPKLPAKGITPEIPPQPKESGLNYELTPAPGAPKVAEIPPDIQKQVDALRLTAQMSDTIEGTNLAKAEAEKLLAPYEAPKEPPLAPTTAPPVNGAKAPADHVMEALVQARETRAAQERLYSKERGARVGQATQAGQAIGGQQGYYAGLGKLKGELPKAEYHPLQNLDQSTVDDLFTQAQNNENLRPFERIRLQTGLAKLFGEGKGVPTKSEIKLMEKGFGADFAKEVEQNIPVLSKAGGIAGNVLNIPRSLMASFDVSAPFRQGLFLSARYPKEFFGNFKQMFKDFGSERAFQGVMDDIVSRPNAELYKNAKLAIMDIGDNLSQREESFMSNFAERIPVIGRVVRASDRAYTGFLNKVRADVFDRLVGEARAMGRDPLSDAKLGKDLASFVNAASGRGSLGKLERAAVALNSTFFSPRLIASRINLLNPVYYVKLDPFVRKQALQSAAAIGAAATSILTLAKMGGASVGADPRNADFGKIKIGNTRIDILGGFQQYVRLGAQLASGKSISSTTGKELTLGEGFGKPNRLDLLLRFGESKLAPVPSLAAEILKGKDIEGKPVNVATAVGSRFVPLIIQDSKQLIKEQGKGAVPILAAGLVGAGVQTYGPTNQPSAAPTVAGANAQGGATLEQLDAQDKSELDSLKSAAMKKKTGDYTIQQLPSGKYAAQIDKEFKTFDQLKDARKAVAQDTFKKSDAKSKVIGDTYFYKDKDGDVHSEPKIRHDYDITISKLDLDQDRSYRKKDFDTWAGVIKNKVNALEQKKQLYDPVTEQDDITKIQNQQEDLIYKLENEQDKLAEGKGHFGSGSGRGRVSTRPSPSISNTLGKIKEGSSFEVPQIRLRMPNTNTTYIPTGSTKRVSIPGLALPNRAPTYKV